MELIRYVVLNPVRAGMVDHPGKWSWSSYSAMLGEASAPSWLETDKLLAQFAGKRNKAVQGNRQFVAQGVGQESIWQYLNRQVFLGNDRFVQQMQQKIKALSEDLNILKAQRRPPAPPLKKIAQRLMLIVMKPLWQCMRLVNIVTLRLLCSLTCISQLSVKLFGRQKQVVKIGG